MYWNEERDQEVRVVSDDIVDLAFSIVCRCLPLDHAHALSQTLFKALPWLEEEEHAGVHLIHGAESGHGWQRPEDPEKEVIHLSRRTKLTLRLPKERVADAQTMTGTTLDVDGYAIEVGKSTVRPLSALTTLFSRYVIAPEEDEEQFIQRAVDELTQMSISVQKLLCGRSHIISTPNERIFTRRLMVAELKVDESIRLQQRGLGRGRKLGCGLFIPHKGIQAVPKAENQ